MKARDERLYQGLAAGKQTKLDGGLTDKTDAIVAKFEREGHITIAIPAYNFEEDALRKIVKDASEKMAHQDRERGGRTT